MRTWRLELAGKTDPGRVRENNEDSLAVDETLGLFVVADGMGGHNAGEVASRLATETILDYARKMNRGGRRVVPEGGDPGRSPAARQLEHFIRMANTLIFEKARLSPSNRGMGTTVVAALLEDRTATVAHVGDSRLYIFRNGMLQAATEDHSLVMDQVRRGMITARQAETSTLQNVLTRALGTEETVKVDVSEHPLVPGDVILLCSDGLTRMVPDDAIARVLAGGGTSSEFCDRLIDLAKAAGGVDNITVVVARLAPRIGRGVKGLLTKIFKRGGARENRRV